VVRFGSQRPFEPLTSTARPAENEGPKSVALSRSVSASSSYFIRLSMNHWPSTDIDTATVMETLTALRDTGRTRAIGVCNCN
jgi:diketogulonate reductase-like aldo/keto reductase